MLIIKEERVREAAATCLAAREVLKKLFPEVFEEFYSGARFKDDENQTFIVVHGPDYERRYFLASLDTGYLVPGIEFYREGSNSELTVAKGSLEGFRRTYRGNRRK